MEKSKSVEENSEVSTRPCALVTGASSGIGWDFCHVLADDGYDLVVVARTESKLKELKSALESKHGIKVHVLAKDLQVATAPQTIFNTLQRKKLHVDLLVNNAGFGGYGAFHESELTRQKDMIQVNVTALVELTHLFLPAMVKKGSGGILNVASTAAFQPGPYMNLYFASKAFVLHFTEGLAEEVRSNGLRVSALCPGPTTTGFVDAAKIEQPGLLKRFTFSSSRDVAEFGYQAWKRGQVVAVHNWKNRLVSSAVPFFPRAATRRTISWIHERSRS